MADSKNDEDGEDDNPFSFKKFITDRSKPVDHKSKTKKKTAKAIEKQAVDEQTDDLFPEVVKKGDQNPYSFKAFLKKKKSVGPPTTERSKPLLLRSKSDSSFSSDTDTEDNQLLDNNHSSKTITLVHDTTTLPLKKSPQQDRSPKLGSHDVIINSNTSSSDDELLLQTKESKVPQDLNVNVSHEDHLMEPFPGVVSVISGDHESQLEIELRKMKGENDILTKRLKESEENLKKENKRNKSLSKEVKSLKMKEQSETKALEAMILKVEENLTTANKRSVVAESTIVKLKKEIQKLQAELATSKDPQAIHQTYEELILGVREKANYASQQLTTVTQRADLQIRELCQGIETLKVVSEILYNIDNSFEVKNQ